MVWNKVCPAPRTCSRVAYPRAWSYAFFVWLRFSLTGAQHILDDSQKFITRPDIEAPKWHITVHEPDLVTPGYWFVESYDFLDQSLENGGKWTAPHIFDAHGDLIWSGAYLSQQYDIFDFRVSNVLGEDMLTFLYPRNRTAVVLDQHYNIHKIFQASSPETELDNMHDLHFVDNGKRVLYFYDETKNLTTAQSEAIGFTDWNCAVRENSFRERDLTKDWKVVFSWSSSDHVEMEESTFLESSVEQRCTDRPKGWDFVHVNSVDKFLDDGSYLVSGRHTDTLYKIAPDGSITWRLGGIKSDFDSDFKFAKQHHSRILEHNSTHTIISLLDNSRMNTKDTPTADSSRGMIVALRTDVQPMTGTLLAEYKHPDGPGTYTMGRGSFQVLPNGNVFTCWVHGCQHSEHSADGKLVMEAHVKQRWLKSYRSYKFPFVGLPSMPPDVHSETQGSGISDTSTLVYVSWNGATEVAKWNLHKTNVRGELGNRKPLASLPWSGFETSFKLDGYASYLVLEAVDKHGKPLGRSNVVETIASSGLSDEVLDKEAKWLAEYDQAYSSSWKSRGTYFIAIAICACAIVSLARRFYRRRRRRASNPHSGPAYEMLPNQDLDSFALGDDDDDLAK